MEGTAAADDAVAAEQSPSSLSVSATDGIGEDKKRWPLTIREVGLAFAVVFGFLAGLLGVYMTMPASDYSFLKLPRTLEDIQILRYPLFFFCIPVSGCGVKFPVQIFRLYIYIFFLICA